MNNRIFFSIIALLILLFPPISKCKTPYSTHVEDLGNYIKIYNIDDEYFINKSSGLQYGNSINYSWNINELCVDFLYKGTWYNNTCVDTISNLVWTLYNETNYTYAYANGTITIPKTANITISYFLHDYIDYDKLKITFIFQNLDKSNRIQDSYFYFKVKKIKINNSCEDNALILNTTYKDIDIYNLSHLNLQYSSEIKENKFELWKRDYVGFSSIHTEFRWYDNYEFWLIVNDTGDCNSEVYLKQKIGQIDKNSKVELHYSWRDPDISYYSCSYSGTCSCTGSSYFCWTPDCCNLGNCNAFCPSLPNAQVVYNGCSKSCSGCSRSCSSCAT